MKNILVLGYAGFIGRHLCKELLKQEYNVLGYDKSSVSAVFRCIQGDFVNELDFEKILKENSIDTVFHLISTTIPKECTDSIDSEIAENIIPSVRLMEAARKCGNIRLILASSGGTVYGESSGLPHRKDDNLLPICGYGMQKKVIEDYLLFYRRIYGLDIRIARISNPYGILPDSDRIRTQGIIPIFIEKMLRHEAISVYGDTVRDYIDIRDAVDALVKIGKFEGENRIFNVGTGKGTRISEIIKMIEDCAGEKFAAINNYDIRSCDVEENVLNIEETSALLSWHPSCGLKAGIEHIYNVLR